MARQIHGCSKGRGLTIHWLKPATLNRFEQLDYIAADNPTAAAALDEEIEHQTDMLAEHPLMGREGRVQGTRELVISSSPFIAVYRVNNKRIEILRILHGALMGPAKP
jgi:toxin ParE1/3/4